MASPEPPLAPLGLSAPTTNGMEAVEAEPGSVPTPLFGKGAPSRGCSEHLADLLPGFPALAPGSELTALPPWLGSAGEYVLHVRWLSITLF